eukprot:Tbor_TRINITY_DN6113_c2_g7::TRINITY_DN6113_c2_g7_i1::g.22742::m.22742
MKLVHFTVLLSLPYVVYLGHGAVFRCNSEHTSKQEAGKPYKSTVEEVKVSSAVMTQGCVMRDKPVIFYLDLMRRDIFNLKSVNIHANGGNNENINIKISNAKFLNSAIIIRRGRLNSVTHRGRSFPLVSLQFTMMDSEVSGHHGLSLCAEKDDYCLLHRHSRIRIMNSKFNLEIYREFLDNNYRGVFTFGDLSLDD